MIKDVKIQKAGAVCSLCGKLLRDVTRHPSILKWLEEHDRMEAGPDDPHDVVAAGDDQDSMAGRQDGHPTSTAETRRQGAGSISSASGEPAPSRVDVCPDCWARDHKLDYLCYWLARRKPPKEREKKDRKGRNAFLRELFYHYYNNEHASPGEGLAGQADDESAEDVDAASEDDLTGASPKTPDELERERDLHLYLLAHLLMRYKVFQWKGAKTDRKKRRWLQFDEPAQGQSVKIADVNPDDPALAEVHEELAALLAE